MATAPMMPVARQDADPLAAASVSVLDMGRMAQVILQASESGEVIAVFRRSFYIRLGSNVVCVGGPGLGRGPLNVRCRIGDSLTWCERLAVGAPVECRGADIIAGDRLRFDHSGAALWTAPAATGAVSIADLRTGLERLAEEAVARSPGGLGILVGAPGAPFSPRTAGQADGLLRRAAETIGPLGEWCAAALAGSPEPPPGVEGLIGLGGGLTPSGDDFLCGAMAALHWLGRGAVARRLAARVLPAAQTGTSIISASYLRCAAEGEASEVLFDALQCVVSGAASGLEPVLDAVHAVGHTSGWDSLAGAAAACAALCAAEPAPPS